MLEKIRNFLEWVGSTAADLFSNGTKDNDLVIGILAILLVSLFAISIVFVLVSWITGIGFWWICLGAFILYVVYCISIRMRINKQPKK